MRAKRSPPVLVTLILSFCTALLCFAVIRSFTHEAPLASPEEPVRPVLLIEEKPATPPQVQEEPLPPPLPPAAPIQKHVVQERESLSSISKKYYGTETEWERIWKANQQTIPNHHRIRPGLTLVIPPRNEIKKTTEIAETTEKK